jgi:hypothetical protein
MMCTRRRSFALVLVAGALGVGLIAFPGSAAAVLTCNPGPANDSCVAFSALPNPAAVNTPAAYPASSSLFIRFRGKFLPNARWSTVALSFDDDFLFTQGTIPTCAKAQLAGKDIAGAWATCGPGAAAANNAYLSPPNLALGHASTAPPSNFDGCTLVFKGPPVSGNPTLTLYARMTSVQNGVVNCANPATNHAGNTTFVFSGTFTNVAAPYAKKLTIPSLNALPVPLDDFYATVQRGSYFRARCPNPAGPPDSNPWGVLGRFIYTAGNTPTSNLKTVPC